MNYTQNYQLSQWVESDRVLMEDFNRDNAKIDAALAASPIVRVKDITLSEATIQYNFPLHDIQWENYVELILLAKMTSSTTATNPLTVRLDNDAGTSAYYDASMTYGQSALLTTSLGNGVTSLVIRIPYTYLGFPIQCVSQTGTASWRPAFNQVCFANVQKLRSAFQTMNFTCSGGIAAGSRFSMLGLRL